MQTRTASALSLALTFSSALVWAGEFEGVIHMKSTFGGKEAKVTESDWFLKGDHIRMEAKPKHADQADRGPMAVMIFNADKKVSYHLLPEKRMYVEHSTDDTVEKTAEHFKNLKYEIVRTGKTDSVAGYRCEIFETRSKETGKIRGESCAAQQLANMGALMGLSRSGANKLSADIPQELRQLIKEGFFVLRMTTKDDEDAEKMRMEATAIEKKRLDHSLFVPPADYTKFDMNTMMEQRTRARRDGGNHGEGQVDVQEMFRDMQKRKAERGGSSGSKDPGGQQVDVQDLMKNFGEMMKKKSQGGE